MGIRIQSDSFDYGKLRDLTGDTILLSFSCGKDSLAAWLALRAEGFRVVPFYSALVPGLEFVETSLRYYESFFGTRIYRTVHPNFYRFLHNDHYQPPGRVAAIEHLSLPLFDYDDVADGVRRSAGVESAWVASGVRKAESVMRAKRMKRDGMNHRRRYCCPIMDWRKDDVIGAIKDAGVLLPVDYEMFGRSFDDLYARYLIPIRDRFPQDYERIRFWFPMVDTELSRFQLWERSHAARNQKV